MKLYNNKYLIVFIIICLIGLKINLHNPNYFTAIFYIGSFVGTYELTERLLKLNKWEIHAVSACFYIFTIVLLIHPLIGLLGICLTLIFLLNYETNKRKYKSRINR